MIFVVFCPQDLFLISPTGSWPKMLYAVGAPLPEYRIRASNDESDQSNPIYDDEYARRIGFRSGLVSGASIYAYMSRSLIEFVGKDWLERGSTDVRFVHPIYEGEELRVTGQLKSVAKDGTLCMDYQASNSQGVACSCGTATLPLAPPSPAPKIRDYPAGRRKMVRSISLELLKVGESLTPVKSTFTWTVLWEYCQKRLRDHHPIYRDSLHPGWLLAQANLIFSRNFEPVPWILVSSSVQKYRRQDKECVIETRGRVADKFEHKGHHFVVLDLAAFASKRCLETIRHTLIFRIAPRAA
jgi:hypothetical protein